MLIAVIIAAIIQGIVGLFIYQKKRDDISNIAFALVCFTSLFWALTNYVYTVYPARVFSLEIIRFVLFFVVVQNTVFFIFSHNYLSSRQTLTKRRLQAVIAASLVVALATLSPFVFSSGTVIAGQTNPNPGILIPLFMLHAMYTIGSGLRSLIKRMHHSHGRERNQLKFILFASVVNWVVVPITNFAITLALHTTLFAKISPFYTLAFAGIIAYAMVTQKLFDIRSAVARSVGYVMVVLTITVIYGLGLFGVIDVLFKGPDKEVVRQVISLILITPLALMFHKTRQYFDAVSNRLFYRDAYDTQDVLDQIGRVVVSEIDLYRSLAATRQILTEALKVSFVEFALIKNENVYFEARTSKTVEPPSLFALGQVIREQKKSIIIADEPGSASRFRQKFAEANVAISLRLKTQDQVVGYILLGEKRSGDIFSAQDKKLLEIMASQLSVSIQNALRFEEIQNFNLTLQARVSEATRKLRTANEKMKVLDETKDDFISMASHQLRTPLTSIKGYISMVMEGDAGKLNAQQEQMLGQAFFSSQRMVFLIADLLNLSRLKTGKFIIEATPVNLAEVVEQELHQLRETAASRGHTLDYVKPAEFPTLMLDETKIRQVIMNFTDNAIYYTPNGGHIVVRLLDNPTTVELRIEDNGIGVPKHEQPHLFTKFYRAGNARKARPDGTGLGLFMAKKVIVASGGSLIFETVEGKGSTFGFRFVKSRLAVPEQPATTASMGK